jgi:hypothetical protein
MNMEQSAHRALIEARKKYDEMKRKRETTE